MAAAIAIARRLSAGTATTRGAGAAASTARTSRLERELLPIRAECNLRSRGRPCVSRLENLLQRAQVGLHLPSGIFAEELRDDRAEDSAGRVVAQDHLHLGAAIRNRPREVHRPGVVDLRSIDGAPADQLVRNLVEYLRVPLHLAAGRTFGHPVRALVVEHRDRLQVRHEARQVREVAPEAIELLGRAIDRHRLLDADAAAVRHADVVGIGRRRRRRQPHRLVNNAVSRRAAPDQAAADAGEHEPGNRPPRQPVRRQRRARHDRKPPLRIVDVDRRFHVFHGAEPVPLQSPAMSSSVAPPPVRPVTLDEIYAARVRIAKTITRTPLVRLRHDRGEPELWLKLETLQPINAFKIRGAANAVAMLSAEARSKGVWTISAGNAGQGVAFAARDAGIPCTVVAIETAPETKHERMRKLGARIVKAPFDACWRAMEVRESPGVEGTFVHPTPGNS